MTLERERYLAKCSKREKYLRRAIADSKVDIKTFKSDLKINRLFSRTTELILIRHNKIKLNAYRHELARIKGMDRVVVIKESQWLRGTNCVLASCKCGDTIVVNEYNYCPTCGRKILWEKGK